MQKAGVLQASLGESPFVAVREDSIPWRLWPGVLCLLAYWGFVSWVALAEPKGMPLFFVLVAGAPLLLLGLLFWWIGFSRSALWEKVLVPLVFLGGMAAAAGLSPALAAKTLPIEILIYATPLVATVTVLASGFLRSLPMRRRWLNAVIVVAWGVAMLLRFDGQQEGMPAFSFRWTPTGEEKFLRGRTKAVPTDPSNPLPVAGKLLVAGPQDWTGFRGADRNASVRGVGLATDWKGNSPKILWTQRLGLGWGSVVVADDHLFTQEQRGEEECVVCYDACSGKQLWEWKQTARYIDPPSGAGPRATPLFYEGRIFAVGATGVLVCLDASTGREFWKKELLKDLPPPGLLWGYATSPLAVNGLVMVFQPGADGHSLTAFRAENGEQVWRSGEGNISHSSPQLMKLQGVEQVVWASDKGMQGMDPASGKVLWSFEAPLSDPALQPCALNGSRVLLGNRLLKLDQVDGQWSVRQDWVADTWKVNFNDSVVLDDAAYGYDGVLFTCRGMETGERLWKKGRYGNGQILLVEDQQLLLVVTEKGELVLVKADKTGLKEEAKLPLIEGKTWNHPALVGNRFYVRNSEMIACVELPTTGQAETTATAQ